jgi:hypothetical protein
VLERLALAVLVAYHLLPLSDTESTDTPVVVVVVISRVRLPQWQVDLQAFSLSVRRLLLQMGLSLNGIAGTNVEDTQSSGQRCDGLASIDTLLTSLSAVLVLIDVAVRLSAGPIARVLAVLQEEHSNLDCALLPSIASGPRSKSVPCGAALEFYCSAQDTSSIQVSRDGARAEALREELQALQADPTTATDATIPVGWTILALDNLATMELFESFLQVGHEVTPSEQPGSLQSVAETIDLVQWAFLKVAANPLTADMGMMRSSMGDIKSLPSVRPWIRYITRTFRTELIPSSYPPLTSEQEQHREQLLRCL